MAFLVKFLDATFPFKPGLLYQGCDMLVVVRLSRSVQVIYVWLEMRVVQFRCSVDVWRCSLFNDSSLSLDVFHGIYIVVVSYLLGLFKLRRCSGACTICRFHSIGLNVSNIDVVAARKSCFPVVGIL